MASTTGAVVFYKLTAYISKGMGITREGAFDSLNVICGTDREIYIVYFHGYHPAQSGGRRCAIFAIVSRISDTGASRGCSISAMATTFRFTNCISRYYRADHVLSVSTGILNAKWNDSFEKLCGKEALERLNFLALWTGIDRLCIYELA